MKKLLTFLLFGFGCGPGLRAQVAITRDGSQPDSSAMLDIKSTEKGMLIPRMSSLQRQAIGAPAVGLMVFDNDQKAFLYYNGTGWVPMGAGAGSGAGPWKLGPAGTDFWYPNVPVISSDDSSYVGIGTTTPYGRLDVNTSDGNFGVMQTSGPVHVGTYIGGGAGWIGTFSGHPLYLGASEFWTNASPQMTFTTTGIVGINTATPNSNYILDVNGAVNSSANVDAVVLNAKDSVKAPIIHGTRVTLAGGQNDLNFTNDGHSWDIEERASSYNLYFSYNDGTGQRVVFVFTPSGEILGGNQVLPNSTIGQPVQRVVLDQQQLIGQQAAQIKTLTERLEALEKKVAGLKFQ